MDRRRFLQLMAAAIAAGLAPGSLFAAEPEVKPSKLPRWRGFNLLEMFTGPKHSAFQESDFSWMADWGFDFVRLPLSYLCWSDARNWKELREPALKRIDQAVDLGKRYKIHVNICFHRAPGYCVNPPKEPFDLWKDEQALDACAFHWGHFAERYRGIPSTRVSFDLLNEPANLEEATYVRVVRKLVEAIRAKDKDRLIIADGLRWGTEPVHGLADLNIAQSARGYDPMQVSHYKASWIGGSDKWAEPTWPLIEKGKTWDKDELRRKRIVPWKALEKKNVGIHVGEWGAFNKTPHKVALAWMRDSLELWKEAGWGWALWNFRGGFGILDSDRQDVTYEIFKGHKLDKQMLELLRAW